MKNLKLFSLFLLLIIAGFSLQAQNGNAVVSEVKVEDLGDGTGMIVVRISGNQASNYLGGTFSISGDRVVGGTVAGGIGNETRVIVEPPVIG
ncbi:MAG TPA: hypothetical protein VHS96_07845, partial [Bacteroidia bacterium]|nr:hypothetical protein [Bacteroidia bacterium]